MWDFLGNRAAVVLISVTCGCVLIYNAWGAILALAFSLLLVLYVCYSLLVNDSLVSPHAYYLLVYLREAVFELCAVFNAVVSHGVGHARELWRSANRYYRERFPFRMDRHRGSKSYQLSSDPCNVVGATRLRDSLSKIYLIEQLSPIPRATALRSLDDTPARYRASDHDHSQQPVYNKYTSTPVLRSDRGDSSNGGVGVTSRLGEVSSKRSTCARSHPLSRGENLGQFSPEGSPWGTSISPKMRPRPAGVKTVQTIAGPLLASTRYNIDPKIYTDVSSPGLTTRLTKYATEARTKLTHQPQYSTGQFPRVNLNVSPIPLLNSKSTKLKVPVTVRLAPPEVAARYSPPERQRLLSNIRHTTNAPVNKSATNVVQVLKEISLKRHASTEDVSFDIAKKQRTEGLFPEEIDMVYEENKQKRSRDDSSKSEEDLSPQNKSIRPAKRTKIQSCYDILNSLSSSARVLTSGVKRKAVDFSRSNTPDFEKHFKSWKSTQPSSPILPQSRNLDASSSKSKEIYSRSPESCDKVQESPLIKGILKTSNKELRLNLNKLAHKDTKSAEIDNAKSVKLTDKLFMRAEPERNERFKLLVQEQSNIKAKFAMENVEEISREDIRNMRQSSMKARLRSMFDAISGNVESKINPDVVIQADDVNAIAPVTCSNSCATLSSSTTTTNINTTPITTAAIVPSSLPTAKPDTKVATTFSLPNAEPQLNTPIMGISQVKETNTTAKTHDGSVDQTKVVSIAPVVASKELLQNGSSITKLTGFTFNKPVMERPSIITPSSLPNFTIGTCGTSVVAAPVATTTTLASSTSTNFLGNNKMPLSSTFVPINSTSNDKGETSNTVTTTANLPTTVNVLANSTFTFAGSGDGKLSTSRAVCAQTSTPSLPSRCNLVGTTTIGTTNTSFDNATNSTSINVIATSAPVQAPSFTFGGGNTTSQTPKSCLFAFGQSGRNVQSTNAFENIPTSQTTSLPQDTNKSFGFASNAASTSTVTNGSFNASTTTTTIPTFELSTAPTFSLGTPTITTSSTSKSLFVFGANSASTMVTAATTANTGTTGFETMNDNVTRAAFGTPTTTVTTQFRTPTTSTPQFGVPTTTVSQFSTPTTSIFAATSSTTTASIFGTTNSQLVFGAATSTPATTDNIFNSPKTTAASIFTAITQASSSDNPVSPSMFSGPNVNTNVTTASSSVFGSGTPAIFGQTKPSTSFGTAGSGIFGSTVSPLFATTTQTTTASAFGVANAPANNTIASTFDTTSTNATPASTFGAPSARTAANVQNVSTPTFGGTTTNLFGSTDTAADPGFFGGTAFPSTSTSTSTFGGQNSGGFAFGATNSGSAATFGDSKLPFGATPVTTTGFGSSLPVFGTANANNTSGNTSNMFFGNTQKDGQQNPTFSFPSTFNAGSNNPSTNASSTLFQFKPTTKPAATGFNFTTSSANPTINFGASTPPTFNPSTPGTFSIGSGSTAPRSRTIRTRKPR